MFYVSKKLFSALVLSLLTLSGCSYIEDFSKAIEKKHKESPADTSITDVVIDVVGDTVDSAISKATNNDKVGDVAEDAVESVLALISDILESKKLSYEQKKERIQTLMNNIDPIGGREEVDKGQVPVDFNRIETKL